MNTFEEKFEAAPQWQRNQYCELREAVPIEVLEDIEKRKLLYLAGDEQETVDVFIGLFEKIPTEINDKQIPKPPTPEKVDNNTGVVTEPECPSCGQPALNAPQQFSQEFYYCPWCGQKIKLK